MDAPVYGIDLGTTNSCIAVWKDGGAKILANSFNLNTTPSCVSFADDGVVIGYSALGKLTSNPRNTIFEAKRLIGRKYEPIKKLLNCFPFAVESDEAGYPEFNVQVRNDAKRYSPEEISALVLKKLKEDAEIRTQQEVSINICQTSYSTGLSV